MHTEPKPPHGSAEWLAVRHRDPQGRARLTASVAGVLFDCHPFITPAELATMMLTEEPPPSKWTEEIERGQDVEPVLIERWHRRNPSRFHVQPKPKYLPMYCNGRWAANLDATALEQPQACGLVCPLEVKTAKGYVEEIKGYWFWQGVAQRLCLNGTPGRVEWAWYDSDFVFKQATQWVAQDDLDRLVAAGEEWLSYIDLDMVPPSVVLSAQQVATLHPVPKEEAIDLPQGGTFWIARLRSARLRRAQAEKDEEEAKAALAPVMANAQVALHYNVPVLSWKASKERTSFDAARFQAEHPDLWQQYQKTSPGARTMRILKGFDEMGDGDDGTDDEPF